MTTDAGLSAEPAEPARSPEAEQERLAQATARSSRRGRNALRWVAAVAVTVAVGGGTAFALTIPKRTDMPGLATASLLPGGSDDRMGQNTKSKIGWMYTNATIIPTPMPAHA